MVDGLEGQRVGEEILEYMWIPKIHWGTLWSKIPNRLEHKKRLRERLDKGLLLFGEPGMGKSAIASLILKHAILSHRMGFWVVCSKIPNYQIEKTRFNEEMTVYERLSTVPVLVMDELIVRDDLKYTEFAIERVVRDRADAELQTVITTNYKPDILKNKFPELYSILTEVTTPIWIKGKNFRDV